MRRWSLICTGFFVLMALLLIIHFCLFPRSACHLTYEIADSNNFTSLIIFGYGVALAWVALGVSSLLSSGMSAFFMYLMLILPIQSKEFRVGRIPGQQALPKLRTVAHLPNIYRGFQLLTNIQNYTLSPFLLPLQTVALYLTIFCNIMLIRYWGILNSSLHLLFILLSFVSLVLWTLILSTFAKMHMWGKKSLQSWKGHIWGNRRAMLYMKAFHLSCRPLSVGCGKFYVVKPISVLRFLRAASRGTFRVLLLAFKHG